jgi:glyoxylate reductase
MASDLGGHSNAPFRVFVSSPLPAASATRLAASGAVVTTAADDLGLRDPRFDAAPDAFEALVVLLTHPVDAALVARASALRVVSTVSVGVDHIDLAACAARGIVVTNTPGVLTEATADLAFGLLLAAARRIAEGDRIVRAGGFSGWGPSFMVGARVQGATLGLVGLGRIGSAVARRARGFGMKVLYTQRTQLAPEMERALGARYATLDALFAESDFVSLHCPLSPEIRHIVNRARLASMKAGSVLVNAARGACVDEAALAEALAGGPLGAAALDVFEDEPRVHPALLARANVVLTPHIGSAEAATREAMAALAVENVVALIEGREAPNRVGHEPRAAPTMRARDS